MKKLLVFASGDEEGGGSGARKLAENAKAGVLQAEIVGFVSNHPAGGVFKHAQEMGIPFFYFPGPYTAENYQSYLVKTGAEFVACSGWIKYCRGLPSDRTVNIHPAPLYRFGGQGMYGLHVHEVVLEAFRRGEITCTEVCMHFVIEDPSDKEKGFDKGPVFFRVEVEIQGDDIPKSLQARVNKVEHAYQSIITNKVVTGQIRWDGKNPLSLVGAEEYRLSAVGI